MLDDFFTRALLAGVGVAVVAGLAGAVKEHITVSRLGRRLPAVIGVDSAGLGGVMDQEGAAADARRLRFDQAQHHLGGDGGVDGAAPGAQHVQPRFGGQGMAGDDHVLRSADRLRRSF